MKSLFGYGRSLETSREAREELPTVQPVARARSNGQESIAMETNSLHILGIYALDQGP